MPIELWGTFSVRDHLEPRAFVADVLLYDRLVIPTLPDGRSESEWPRSWNLAKQKSLLRDLGELAIAIPWDNERRQTWQDRFDSAQDEVRRKARTAFSEAVGRDVERARQAQKTDLPYYVTRETLQDAANHAADDKLFKKLRATRRAQPGSQLEVVCAYPSFERFAVDVPSVSGAPPLKPFASPGQVFGWTFFVPESDDTSESED